MSQESAEKQVLVLPPPSDKEGRAKVMFAAMAKCGFYQMPDNSIAHWEPGMLRPVRARPEYIIKYMNDHFEFLTVEE
jgi:hypothetical protein